MAYSAAMRETHRKQLDEIRQQGIFKEERTLHSPQSASVMVEYPAGARVNTLILEP